MKIKKALDYPRALIILDTPRILITLLMLYARNERLTLAPELQVQVFPRRFLVFLSSRNNPGPCLI
jgi:hypothetical protein